MTLPPTTCKRASCTLLAVLGLACGCAAPRSTGSARVGTFENISDSSATLDLSFIRSVQPPYERERRIPIGSRWVWTTILRDSSLRQYQVSVELYAKHSQLGWMANSCPVWSLTVGGRSTSKDTEGYGHWPWEGTLEIEGVKLGVYNTGEQAMVYIAQ